jgi:hypothetical protein
MAGYSEKPLLKKLGYQEGFRIYVLNPPQTYFELLGKLPLGAQVVGSLKAPLDLVHFFPKNRVDYESRLMALKKTLTPKGMIWVSWPKKSSKVPTDLSEELIRNFGLKSGLVDIKICAVDETWSGLKFVVPVKDRK